MNNHPDIKVPAGKWERLFHFLALMLFISIIIYIIATYRHLPDQIPVHMNAKGVVDDWGNKATILALPLVSIPLFVILYFLGKYPHIHNYPVKVTEENAEQLYRQSRFMFSLMNAEIMGTFFLIVWDFVQVGKGNPGLGGWTIGLTVAPILITLIYFIVMMRKLKPSG